MPENGGKEFALPPRPFRFAVQSFSADDAGAWRERARRSEALGYSAGLAAREAQIVSLNFNNRSGVLGPDGVRSGTAEATAEKLGWVREAAGERFASLELEIGAYFTFVTDRSEATAQGLGGAFGLTGDQMRQHPHALIGSVDAICEELERRRDQLGLSYVTVGDTVAEDFAPVVARLAGK